ncbi:kinetochore protein SPC25 homolog isoform X2 [Actinidia eriantha]|uniref:kinetochore protein SPC25 homolog isoform X2 n=1 Tax=Actinidia eriantha TaxID=165200 RepID=UPI00258AFF41|nr:kinetochore protein SPC25 homolog isoform X2 [Actinidia eriantha]
MQSGMEGSVRTKMEELRLVCDREIPIQQQRVDAAIASFRKSLESTRAKARETVQNQEKLGKLKAELREAEDDLVKALAVKTRKVAKRMATMDSLSAAKARIEELKRIVEDQMARKNEYAEIISQQYEEKCNTNTENRGEIEEAISWYNMVLGFRIECGHGVKFIFTNINVKNPKEEYSFSVRHEKDLYTLLDCDPHLDGTKELIHELNKTNGLFKFVRTMREKFQEVVAHGISPQVTSLDQDCSTISESAPVSSVSTDSRSEFVSNQKEIQPEETNRQSKKVNYGRGGKLMAGILSPGSASSLRRSSRSKVKK